MLTTSKAEFEASAVVVLIDEDGAFKWSSRKSAAETAHALRAIADVVDELSDEHDDSLAEPDGAPCCPDPQCTGRNGGPCTFPGYADNH